MKIIFIILSPFFQFLSYLFVKNVDIWCFGAWFGEKYTDNSKYLFEYVSLNSSIKAVWICNSYKLKYEINQLGFTAYTKFSLKGLFFQLRAKVFVCTINSSDFYFACITRRSYFFQLWHGSPIKRIGFDSEKGYWHKKKEWMRKMITDNYKFILSPAKIFDSVLQSGFAIHPNKIKRSGYPRNDGLFISDEKKLEIRTYFNVKKDQLFLIYLPTHRGEGIENKPLFDFINKMILNALTTDKFKIIIKPHYYDINIIKESSINLIENNIYIDFGDYDLYEVLASSDGIITDYSSIFLDYEILNKPVFFYAPDIEEYKSKGRGLYFDYDYFAEKFSKDFESLLSNIIIGKSNLRNGITMNNDKNGNYSEKVFKLILSEIA